MRRMASGFFGMVLFSAAALAQTFPERAITLIVPFAAGGSSDIIARIVAEEMRVALNQTIVIENVAGAGGATGLSRLAAATPDGYTIGIGNAGTSAAVYSLQENLKFTPQSFEPIGMVAKTMPVIAIKNDFPAKDLNEFIAFARQNPGKITFGHAGKGSSNHLICELFLQAAKVDITLIGYRGAGPALNDAIGGHIDGVCDGATSVASAIAGGKVRGLVVSAKQRAALLPNVATAAEAGLPAFVQEGWNVIFAPKGTPAPVIETLNKALREAAGSEKVAKRFAELGTLTTSGDEHAPSNVRAFVLAEVQRYADLLKR